MKRNKVISGLLAMVMLLLMFTALPLTVFADAPAIENWHMGDVFISYAYWHLYASGDDNASFTMYYAVYLQDYVDVNGPLTKANVESGIGAIVFGDYSYTLNDTGTQTVSGSYDELDPETEYVAYCFLRNTDGESDLWDDDFTTLPAVAPTATINYVTEKFENLTDNEIYYMYDTTSYDYLGSFYRADGDGFSYSNIIAAHFGTTFGISNVLYSATYPYDHSEVQTISVPARPSAPSPTGYDETIVGSNNGSITGVDSTMEYKLSTDSSWTSITGTSVTGLAPSTYNVRVAASNVNSNFYGSSTNVTINAASAICSIGSVEYGSLDAALAAVDNNETILLLENITLSDDLVINNGKEFTLNANNKTIDFDYDFLLNIYSGDVTFNNYSFDNLFLVEVYNNNGSGTSLKATFNGNLELTEGCLYTFGDGTEVFVNGDLTSQGDGVQAYAFSKVTINGNINTHGDGVLCYGGASVIVTGDISSDSRGIYAHGTQYIPDSEDIRSNVLVEGNVVAYDSGVECWAGAFVEVKGSVTSEEATGVYCNGTAEQNPTMLTEVFVRVDVYGGSGDYGAGAVAYGNGQITIDGSLVASFNRILVNGTFRDKKDNTTFKTNYDQYSNYLTMEGFNPSEDVQYLTVVWLRNPSTPKPPASSTSDPVVTTAPKTGDTVNMLTWIILLIASAFVVCTFFVIRRKRESNMQ